MPESPSESIAPKKDLDDYIADPFNQSLFQDLEEFEWQPNALDFFKWFYELVGFIDNGKPSAVLQNLDAHKLDGPFRLWLVYQLRNKFRDPFSRAWSTGDENLPPAFHVIDTEYERLEKLYPPDVFAGAGDDSIHAKASAAVGRGKMINELLVNMVKKHIQEGEEKAKLEAEITLRVRQEERERLQTELSNMAHEVLKSLKQPKQNPEFTTNRQVIALCYLLQAVGVEANSSEQSRFIEFLTNKTNKEIYKRVLAIDSTVYNLDGKDAIYVRDWFNKLGLSKLAKKIDEILAKPHLEL